MHKMTNIAESNGEGTNLTARAKKLSAEEADHPIEWKSVTFADLFNFLTSGNNSRSDLGETGDFLYIHYGDIHKNNFCRVDLASGDIPRISKDKVRGLPLLEDGDLIIADASEDQDGIGKSVEVINLEGKAAVAGLHTILLRSKNLGKSTITGYHGLIQNIPKVRREILRIATGLKVFGISKKQLKTIRIPLPPLHEQKTIATALIDVDELIEGLDKLIAKKRDIKLATMQQLLTGKRRLPGFNGEWEQKRVLELGEVVTGGTPKTSVKEYWGTEYPWITPTDISVNRDMSSSERWLTQKGLEKIRCLPPNTVLITCIASIGKNAILRTSGACNQQINAVIPNNKHDCDFLYYVIEANKQYLLTKAGATATSIISKVTFSEITFVIPSLEEQTAIATVLSDMDKELTNLEARRDKIKALKQGMMQELLTGRIRLV